MAAGHETSGAEADRKAVISPHATEISGISEEEAKRQFRIGLTQSELRWGVVRMPPYFDAQFTEKDGFRVGHLAFGTREQLLSEPVEDRSQLYI